MGKEITWRLALGNSKGDSHEHPENDHTLRCSFCHKSQAEVAKLFSSPSDRPSRAYICNECIDVCNSVIEQDPK
jgi:hypothetical protein